MLGNPNRYLLVLYVEGTAFKDDNDKAQFNNDDYKNDNDNDNVR